MSESSSSSDDEAVLAACMAAAASAQAAAAATEGRIGSKPGRAANRELGVKKASARLDKDYFCRFHDGVAVFNEKEFERTYRMPRSVYETVRLAMMEGHHFFCRIGTRRIKMVLRQTWNFLRLCLCLRTGGQLHHW